jgi:hypothetical protein
MLLKKMFQAILSSLFAIFMEKPQSQSYVTTDNESDSLSWCQNPIWDPGPDLCYCQRVAGLLIWAALSDERTVLSFIIDAGFNQRSHSRGRVPRDSWPYFTVSDSRLSQSGGPGSRIYIPRKWPGYTPRHWVPFSLPPTTRRATVKVFELVSTQAREKTENYIANGSQPTPFLLREKMFTRYRYF